MQRVDCAGIGWGGQGGVKQHDSIDFYASGWLSNLPVLQTVDGLLWLLQWAIE